VNANTRTWVIFSSLFPPNAQTQLGFQKSNTHPTLVFTLGNQSPASTTLPSGKN
jgi:hypothetical protein